MKRRKKIELGCAVALWGLMCTGCRKDLCYNHDEHSPSVKVTTVHQWEPEWERPYDRHWQEEWNKTWNIAYEDLRPRPAKGVRALIYHENGVQNERHLPASGGRLPLDEGRQELLFYNNDTESIVYNGLTSTASAQASTRSLSRGHFQDLHKGERTVTPPDMLFGHYIEEYVAQVSLEAVQLPITLKPLVYTYLIRYEIDKGLQHVALARGALAGMAEKVYLKDGHTDNEAATFMYDCVLKGYGAETQLMCFGVPNFPGDHYTRADGTPASFTLNLELRFKNGNIQNFTFNVTGQLLAQPRGGVIVVNGIEIDEESASEEEGGFDANVDGWGDYIDIPLPFDDK